MKILVPKMKAKLVKFIHYHFLFITVDCFKDKRNFYGSCNQVLKLIYPK